jgi:hypothetical protein
MSSLFDAVLKGAPSGRGSVMDEAAWRRVVGVNIARRTLPMRLNDGVLTVRVATSSWAQELSLLKVTLCERLTSDGMAVRDIRFQVGPVEPPQRSPEVQVRVPFRPRVPLPNALLGEIEKVPDQELRVSLARAAAANLAWQALVLAQQEPKTASAALRDARAPLPAAAESAPSARSSPPGPASTRDSRGGRRG